MAGGSGSGSGDDGLCVRVCVYAQQRGKFDIMASVSNEAGLVEARAFTYLMRRVQEELGRV